MTHSFKLETLPCRIWCGTCRNIHITDTLHGQADNRTSDCWISYSFYIFSLQLLFSLWTNSNKCQYTSMAYLGVWSLINSWFFLICNSVSIKLQIKEINLIRWSSRQVYLLSVDFTSRTHVPVVEPSSW